VRIGVDIVDIPRIRKAYEKYRDRFLKRVYSDAEIDYAFSRIDPFPSLAVRFAAKEAILKASGLRLPYHRIEILGRPPQVFINGRKGEGFSISLSHSSHDAVAVVIWVDTGN